ncbi:MULTISPECIES: hypothetical protein [Salinibaculum]|uniref:hypothetical protein n=1 Tax=Salinibaculum TaxID=2732368 RepID=UPI0030CD34C6
MQQSQHRTGRPTRPDPGETAADSLADPTEAAPTEDIHIRNYDVQHSYRVRVTVTDGRETVFARRYTLDPGQSTSERDIVDAGTYDVTVALDSHRSARTRCRLADSPDDTALVEVGNGIVSVSQGLYR